uniref:Retrotransposon gag domain-containing protein n=1 Tax=Aegilops tauschii subsp. strangulata TaxID=200361 RepID=A0A453DKY0_AEGTS
MHNLTAHHMSWEPAFFITHFFDGLLKEIRAAVLLHRPQTLDTAVDLACLQEEVLETMKRDDRRGPSGSSSRSIPRTALPLPLPPLPRLVAGAGADARAEDRRATEAARAPAVEDKMATLRAYRRAKGLCFTCGERWSRDHRCGPTVQLHVVEEMLEMMQSSESDTGDDLGGERTADCCVLSREAFEGGESPTTMRLHGWVQDREVLMLVDSGSSHSFVSAALAVHLQGAQASRYPLSVRVANGGQMRSVQEIPDCPWQTQGVGFHTSFKISRPLQF